MCSGRVISSTPMCFVVVPLSSLSLQEPVSVCWILLEAWARVSSDVGLAWQVLLDGVSNGTLLPSGLRPFFSSFLWGRVPVSTQPTKKGCPPFSHGH